MRGDNVGVSKSASLSQRNRRKLREAQARRHASQICSNLGGTCWKYVEFDLRPYAGKVMPSAYDELKAATTPPKPKNLPKHVSEVQVRKYLAERNVRNS